MATYITRTQEFGKITFSTHLATETRAGYVYMEAERGAWVRATQICYGGDFHGNTITSTELELKADAQKWLRDRRAWKRALGV